MRTSKQIDIDNSSFYKVGEPREETRRRLQRMIACGMTEVGVAQFGIDGVTSGLYIEMVWTFTHEQFQDYMTWAVARKQAAEERYMVDVHYATRSGKLKVHTDYYITAHGAEDAIEKAEAIVAAFPKFYRSKGSKAYLIKPNP